MSPKPLAPMRGASSSHSKVMVGNIGSVFQSQVDWDTDSGF